MIIGDEEPIIHCPTDDIVPGMDTMRRELADKAYLNVSMDDILS